jgi:hypothetical protein
MFRFGMLDNYFPIAKEQHSIISLRHPFLRILGICFSGRRDLTTAEEARILRRIFRI